MASRAWWILILSVKVFRLFFRGNSEEFIPFPANLSISEQEWDINVEPESPDCVCLSGTTPSLKPSREATAGRAAGRRTTTSESEPRPGTTASLRANTPRSIASERRWEGAERLKCLIQNQRIGQDCADVSVPGPDCSEYIIIWTDSFFYLKEFVYCFFLTCTVVNITVS